MKLVWLTFILPFVFAEDVPAETSEAEDRGWVARGGNAYNGYDYVPGVTPFDVKPVNAHTGRDIGRDVYPNPYPYNGVPNATPFGPGAGFPWWYRPGYPGPLPGPLPGPIIY